MTDNILASNNAFVANKDYQFYETSKLPNKKLAIVTCMDTHLSELLSKALGFNKNHPLITKDIQIYGYIMDSLTGKFNAS